MLDFASHFRLLVCTVLLVCCSWISVHWTIHTFGDAHIIKGVPNARLCLAFSAFGSYNAVSLLLVAIGPLDAYASKPLKIGFSFKNFC